MAHRSRENGKNDIIVTTRDLSIGRLLVYLKTLSTLDA
jgi:hypothetical protein